MNSTYIRDGSSKIIGLIKNGDQGKQFAYAGGKMVGIYNAQLDKTFDSRLHIYGHGNQLIALVRVAAGE